MLHVQYIWKGYGLILFQSTVFKGFVIEQNFNRNDKRMNYMKSKVP